VSKGRTHLRAFQPVHPTPLPKKKQKKLFLAVFFAFKKGFIQLVS
jgi:hypothetical protein